MPFINIDYHSLKYGFGSASDSDIPSFWATNFPPQNHFINLTLNQSRQVDLMSITIQVVTEPKAQIRLSAEIFGQRMITVLEKEGFASRPLPLNPKITTSEANLVTAEVSCDFGDDKESQERAKLFLVSLMFQSKLRSFSTEESKSLALTTLSKHLDKLASKNKVEPLCLGSEWIAPILKSYPAEQAQKKNRKSMMCFGFFAITTAAVAALAVSARLTV